jgi:hypothetical protein
MYPQSHPLEKITAKATCVACGEINSTIGYAPQRVVDYRSLRFSMEGFLHATRKHLAKPRMKRPRFVGRHIAVLLLVSTSHEFQTHTIVVD